MASESHSESLSSNECSDSRSSRSSLSETGEQKSVGNLKRTLLSTRGAALDLLFDQNVLAKIYRTASSGFLKQTPLAAYPHTVPQSGPNAGTYEYREASFWTCGFFPGSIYCLFERAIKYPQAFSVPDNLRSGMPEALSALGQHWSVAIHAMAERRDTHDMGFIVQPALQQQWELTGDKQALASLNKAAYALASRFDDRLGMIRSWDAAINDRYSIIDLDNDFLVIIDSMCNLDLLYYIAHHFNDPSLSHIATSHARNVMKSIIRPEDSSTYHLVNFDPVSLKCKAKMTNQGYRDASTWSRGQAWAVLGFAQTYGWTKDRQFLDAALGCATFFLQQLEHAQDLGRDHPYVPPWDFMAEDGNTGHDVPVVRDTSAALIAANGMLLIHQHVQSLAESARPNMPVQGGDYLDAALRIVREVVDLSLDADFARFAPAATLDLDALDKTVTVGGASFEAIVRNATVNKNEHAHMPYWDHGLVYADFYFLEFGNKLLRMGLC